MNPLIEIITSEEDEVRNRSLDSICGQCGLSELLDHAEALDRFRRDATNLYQRVRALFFLAGIYRYHVPERLPGDATGLIPFDGFEHLLARRFIEAIDTFLESQSTVGPSHGLCSALAQSYHQLGFQTLADQVRRSVRSVRGNQWMFRLGHPHEHPLRLRKELLAADPRSGAMPILRESTAVRMDFSHSAWSDIFFLGMDFPEGARVLNVSVDLAVRGRDDRPCPPIQTFLRVIDEPIFRLASVDLGATVEVSTIAEMFDFGRDYLGLLKAALIASGIVPPGLEGCRETVGELLEPIVGPGLGLELVSRINDIPKGSRLAVSTNLLGSLIAVLMRSTGQVRRLSGPLTESDRRLVAARAILGEWLGGSGGGWQDSGGVWPGIKLIRGATAEDGDPEHGISRGRLMPTHHVLGRDTVSRETRERLKRSLVLVHGGMAQNVGPILEMVTERYLLRSEKEWRGRGEAIQIFDDIVDALQQGDLQQVGKLTTRNFEGPLQTIIPWATNRFTNRLIELCRERFHDKFWGFWMLGGMSGGGMGFVFDPEIKPRAQQWLAETMVQTKRELQDALPFAMDPVVYDFEINDEGSTAALLCGDDARLPDRYYALVLPDLLRASPRDLSVGIRRELERIGDRCRGGAAPATAALLLDSVLPRSSERRADGSSLAELLARSGFDREQHEQIRSDIRSGRFGLSQNRLSAGTTISDVSAEDITDLRRGVQDRDTDCGREAIAAGEVAVVTLAAGVGSRWTEGAGVCKALHPFHRFAGQHRSFLEVHLAKSRQAGTRFGGVVPHVFTTSWLTDHAIRNHLERHANHGFADPLYVSTGRSVGLRLIPMIRDLRFLWEETPQQVLDEQQQKVRESTRAALIEWARTAGEGEDYTDNVPEQCMHPVGHWYEVPNLLRNGTLRQMLADRPQLKTLLLHNIDTLGANVDPGLLGRHLRSGKMLNFEVIGRRLEDRGGGLARVNGRPRLVEGLAMPSEQAEFELTYYNSMTTWIDIDALLKLFRVSREDLVDHELVDDAVRRMATRLPTYVTLKDVKKRWGHAQEDVFPVAQFEKLWGDMSALPEIDCGFFVTSIRRGQQLKSQAQLDGWNRDGSAAFIDSLCEWD